MAAEWVIEPREMASFLNGVAMKTDDEETRFKLAQCSVFVYTMYRALYKEEGLKMDELKPCPFCGSAPILKNSNHKRYKWQVRCTNMLCSCRTARWTEAQGAIDAWNRRVENVQSNISE